jgi:hypothetical protein
MAHHRFESGHGDAAAREVKAPRLRRGIEKRKEWFRCETILALTPM